VSSEEITNKRTSHKSAPNLNARNILSNVYSKDIQTNSYMYKNMVRKNVKNNLPYVSSRPGSKQGSLNGKQISNKE